MDNYLSRYDYGVNTITHKGKSITTSLHTNFMDTLDPTSPFANHGIARLKQYVKERPDAISDIFYNSSAYWWYILLYNNINDPFEGLSPSTKILIPKINVNLRK